GAVRGAGRGVSRQRAAAGAHEARVGRGRHDVRLARAPRRARDRDRHRSLRRVGARRGRARQARDQPGCGRRGGQEVGVTRLAWAVLVLAACKGKPDCAKYASRVTEIRGEGRDSSSKQSIELQAKTSCESGDVAEAVTSCWLSASTT